MAYTDNISRLSRLTAILLKLQTRAYVQVAELAEQFEVSTRTIYRDLRALEASGVPLYAIEGKGYSLVDGYHIPPVMFTEAEANALVFGEKMIAKTKDSSLIEAFASAADKIRAVLEEGQKEKLALLAKRTIIGKNWQNVQTSTFLSEIQQALTAFRLIRLAYLKEGAGKPSDRLVEPFAIYHNQEENWVLIAWCRLRKDFRNFRLDRIETLLVLDETFSPHQMTMEAYVEIQRKKHLGKAVT